MGRFSKFCGRPIEGDRECDCEGAINERQNSMPVQLNDMNYEEQTSAASNVGNNNEQSNPEDVSVANEQNNYVNNTGYINSGSSVNNSNYEGQGNPVNNVNYSGQQFTGGTSNNQPNGAGINVQNVFEDILNVTKTFIKNPFECLKSTFNSNNQKNQLLTGGVAAVIMILLIIFILNSPIIPVGARFKISLLSVLFYSAIKAIYALLVYLFAKNKNPNIRYISVLGMCSVTAIIDVLILFIVLIMMFLTLYEVVALGILFFVIGNVLSSIVIAYIAFGEDIGRTYKLSLILQFIMVCVVTFLVYVIARRIFVDIIQKAMMDGMSNSLNMFKYIH